MFNTRHKPCESVILPPPTELIKPTTLEVFSTNFASIYMATSGKGKTF
jgi:hypothetical protein